MNAEEITHLPSMEQARIVQFVRGLDANRIWTAEELSAAAGELAGENDPERVRKLKEQIAGGFYGSGNA